MARALYFQSQVPIHFSSECVLTATFLRNKTPSPLIGNQTPYELLYQKPVDYISLRVFECLAFTSTLAAHRTKFQPVLESVFFWVIPMVWRPINYMTLKKKQIFVSRDVVFHEDILPFSFTKMTVNLLILFLIWSCLLLTLKSLMSLHQVHLILKLLSLLNHSLFLHLNWFPFEDLLE